MPFRALRASFAKTLIAFLILPDVAMEFLN
jgi:hypothetical protein